MMQTEGYQGQYIDRVLVQELVAYVGLVRILPRLGITLSNMNDSQLHRSALSRFQ